MCATKFRTFEEWDKHPHALAIKATPPVELVKVAEAPKRKAKLDISSPLDGIRILDLTRVLAGPVAGKTLAGKRSIIQRNTYQVHLNQPMEQMFS